MKIVVVGIGYVGLCSAVLLAQHHDVTAVDIVPEKAELLARGLSPIRDAVIEEFMARTPLRLKAATNGAPHYADADCVLIAVPTDYDPAQGRFDISAVDAVLAQVYEVNPVALIVMRSTVPVGYTEAARLHHPGIRLLFCPEFLREGSALQDSLHPSRIVLGVPEGDPTLREAAQGFARLLQEGAKEKTVPCLLMRPGEAEAVKLFANTYLALRVAFFNELDTYAESCGLDAKSIVDGVCLDPRIGDTYNNPSFGYGGYCLPKDAKQLLAQYQDVPGNLICAVVDANDTRKKYVAAQILRRAGYPQRRSAVIGVYRLGMKAGSGSFRHSSVLDVMSLLRAEGAAAVVYEPACAAQTVAGCRVVNDFDEFCRLSDVIICNRWHDELAPVADKVYTRDLYRRD